MWRGFAASVAVVALLFGLGAAPYTHAHQAIESARDEGHPHRQTLVHSHATPHADHHDHDADDRRGGDAERIWSVDSFVFQPAAPVPAPAMMPLVSGEAPVDLTSVWIGAPRLQPRAHGPPATQSLRLRAPPAFLPAFS